MKKEWVETDVTSGELTITLEHHDYDKDLARKLNSLRQTTNLKGFRKGKTPLSAVRKIYGRDALGEIIDQKLKHYIDEFVKEKEMDLLTTPMLSPKYKEVTIDPKQKIDYTFIFDIATIPDFEINGLSENDTLHLKSPELNDQDIEDYIDRLRTSQGNNEKVEEPIDEQSLFSIHLTEKISDDVSRDPFETDTKVRFEDLSDTHQSTFLGKEIGFKTELDLYDLEAKLTEDQVKRYFLGDAPEDVGRNFEVEITENTKVIKPELDQAFFDKNKLETGGEPVTTLEDFKAKLGDNLKNTVLTEVKRVGKRLLSDRLVEMNTVENLPKQFLINHLIKNADKLEAEELDNELEKTQNSIAEELMWRKLYQTHDITVDEQEKNARIIDIVKEQMSRGMPQSQALEFYKNASQDRQFMDYVETDVMRSKLLDRLIEIVPIEYEYVSKDDYRAWVDDIFKEEETPESAEEE